MRIHHHRQQKIGQTAFQFVFLMHQFMGIIDPDRPCHKAHSAKHGNLFDQRMPAACDHIDDAKQCDELQRCPNDRDRPIPHQSAVIRIGIVVLRVDTLDHVKNNERIPRKRHHNQKAPPAQKGGDPNHWQQSQRHPKRNCVQKRRNITSLCHDPTLYHLILLDSLPF